MATTFHDISKEPTTFSPLKRSVSLRRSAAQYSGFISAKKSTMPTFTNGASRLTSATGPSIQKTQIIYRTTTISGFVIPCLLQHKSRSGPLATKSPGPDGLSSRKWYNAGSRNAPLASNQSTTALETSSRVPIFPPSLT